MILSLCGLRFFLSCILYSTNTIIVGRDMKYATTVLDLIVQWPPDCGGVGGPQSVAYLATVPRRYSNINNRFVHDQFPRHRHRNPCSQGLAAVSTLFGTLLIAVPILRLDIAVARTFWISQQGKGILQNMRALTEILYSKRYIFVGIL